ncbi:carbohydrate kinase family protein [Microvirga terricola]|uniref:Carbohydrate kinase family protein n=1 Tax=Microvirga terricola TaxID=2719797 RepID=A0ABX0V5L2_9HYPH|nr:carbohydrate kinase family protein [Microvirga terricola]NIX75028.1 carbohydrate kinase family protein [Microvirga terricola]
MHSSGTLHSVLCLGRTYCDLVFTGLAGLPVLGRELFAKDVAVVPGGGAFITAAHLIGLGRDTSLVTRLGTDPLSAGLEGALAESGVDLTFVERAADAGPQLTVAIVQPQDRAFLSRRAGHGHPATVEAALSSPGVRHLHIAEYATLIEIPGIVASAKAKGLTVSLDPSWDDALIHDPGFLENCRGVDLFLPNTEEASVIARATNHEQILDLLIRHFPIVVLKKGSEGATLATGEGERLSRSAPHVPVVDTTGAGDAFNAGFIHGWLAGKGFSASLAAAIEAGSLSVQAAGGATVLRKIAAE